MADFVFSKPRVRKRSSRDRAPKKESRGGSSEDVHRNKHRSHSGREPSRGNKNRRDLEMTQVTCASCGDECEVPFKPTSNKPVYCSDCFSKTEKSSHDKPSNNKFSDRDIDIINEKLNKIMKALKIK